MEDEAFKQLYQEYLELIFEFNEYASGEKKELKDLVLPHRYVTREEDGVYGVQIVDSVNQKVSAFIRDKRVSQLRYPGVFSLGDKDSPLFSTIHDYCDINGKKITPLYSRFNTYREYVAGVKRSKFGKESSYFFNDVFGTYEPLLYKSLVFEYKYEYGPHEDLIGYMPIYMQNDYYILFVDDDNNIILYKKYLKTYEKLPYNKNVNQKDKSENQIIDADINFDKNIMRINDTYYYLTPYEVIDISGVMKNKEWNRNVRISPVVEKIMSYEDFKNEMKKNKDFMKLLHININEIKEKKYAGELEDMKKASLQTKMLELLKRKKEIIQTIYTSLQELKEIDSALQGGLFDQLKNIDPTVTESRLKVEEEILFINVGDHREINPLFKDYLALIDFRTFFFRNVKVAGLDFSYSNANINPQEVYNRDMSNGNYSGLDFTMADFTNVNICGSTFAECRMDFANLDNAIKDENTIVSGVYSM